MPKFVSSMGSIRFSLGVRMGIRGGGFIILIRSLRSVSFFASRNKKIASRVTMNSRICCKTRRKYERVPTTTSAYSALSLYGSTYLIYLGILNKHPQQRAQNVEYITIFIAPARQQLGNGLEVVYLRKESGIRPINQRNKEAHSPRTRWPALACIWPSSTGFDSKD